MQITLKAARVNAGLKIGEASELLGLKTEDTLRNWECGKTFPNVPQIKMIENLYGVEYRDIKWELTDL